MCTHTYIQKTDIQRDKQTEKKGEGEGGVDGLSPYQLLTLEK